jgi:putative hydrolase of the HAD superfamily
VTRAVLFDLDDTLFDHRETSAEALRRVQAAHEGFRRLPFDEFEKLHTALLDELHPEVLTARLEMDEARRERFRRLFKRCGIAASETVCAATARQYRSDYIDARRVVAGAASLLAAVRRRASVGIVSNNLLREQRDKLVFCGLSAHVDALIVSEEAGVSKPDPAIFRMALDALDARAGETVMLGDSWSADVIGAHAAGIRAVWFNPSRSATPDPRLGVRELHALEPLTAALKCLFDDDADER